MLVDPAPMTAVAEEAEAAAEITTMILRAAEDEDEDEDATEVATTIATTTMTTMTTTTEAATAATTRATIPASATADAGTKTEARAATTSSNDCNGPAKTVGFTVKLL